VPFLHCSATGALDWQQLAPWLAIAVRPDVLATLQWLHSICQLSPCQVHYASVHAKQRGLSEYLFNGLSEREPINNNQPSQSHQGLSDADGL